MADRMRPQSGQNEPLALGLPSVVLDTIFNAVFHTILVFAMYLHFAGHNQPGGGFIAGLVASAGLVLRVITGRPGLRSRFPVAPGTMLGVGVLLVTGTALTSLVLGNALLEHHTWEVELDVLGKIKTTSALPFDTGIFLIVVGVIATLIEIFVGEPDAGDTRNPGRRAVIILLAVLVAWLFAAGTYLILQRALTRIVLGIGLLGHGSILLLITVGGRAGEPPLVGKGDDGSDVAAPLPQAFALTAIVIGFGISAFLLALAYRSWVGTQDDEVQDDLEDRQILQRRIDAEGNLKGEAIDENGASR